MTTQQTNQQDTHHFILTLQVPSPGGAQMATFSNTITPTPDMTRDDIYKGLRKQIGQDNPHLAQANTLFFALERNQL